MGGPRNIFILIHSLVLKLSRWMDFFFSLNNVLTIQEGETVMCLEPDGTPTVPQAVLIIYTIVRKVERLNKQETWYFFWQSSGLHLKIWCSFIHSFRIVCYLLRNSRQWVWVKHSPPPPALCLKVYSLYYVGKYISDKMMVSHKKWFGFEGPKPSNKELWETGAFYVFIYFGCTHGTGSSWARDRTHTAAVTRAAAVTTWDP